MATDNDFDPDQLEDEAPRPKTSGLTIVLCILNVLAAVGFTVLLVLDYSKRQAWSHAVFMHDLKIVGLPLKDEQSEGTSASRLLASRQKLEPAALKAVYTKRGGKSVSEPFQNLDEAFQFKILPQHLTKEVLNEHFQGLGQSVNTLEEEINRVKGAVFGDIEKAATDLAQAFKKESDKRELLRRILMGLARSPELVDRLDKEITALPPGKLDDRIIDAAQRRMLVDILAALEVYRGAPIRAADAKVERKKLEHFRLKPDEMDNALVLDNAAEVDLVKHVDPVKLDKLQTMLKDRLEAALADKYDPSVHFGDEWKNQARDSVDRRKAIANILCTIAHVGRPLVAIDAKEPTRHLLYPEGPDRVMAVVGVFEYTLAYQNLTAAFLVLRPHVLALIEADREGTLHETDGQKRRIGGFVQEYNNEIRELHLIIDTLGKEQKRLADLRLQAKGHQEIVMDRHKHVAENTAELLKAREKTAAQNKELERLQRELFEAQQQLVTAVQINQRLLDMIREAQGLKKRK